MISTILNLIGGLTRLAVSLIEFFERRQLVDAGRAQQQLDAIKDRIDATKIAVAARETVRANLARHPDRLPDDDPFRRD